MHSVLLVQFLILSFRKDFLNHVVQIYIFTDFLFVCLFYYLWSKVHSSLIYDCDLSIFPFSSVIFFFYILVHRNLKL